MHFHLSISLLLHTLACVAWGNVSPVYSNDYSGGLPSWKASFPPREIVTSGDNSKVAAWLVDNVPPMKAPDHTLSKREKELARMSAADYISARRSGQTTCRDYASALVKRMKYYAYMAQFMYWDNMPNQTNYIVDQAAALDRKAELNGVEAIAPLYGLVVPVKGTLATVDFPSSAGSGVLHNYFAAEDAEMVTLLRRAHAVIMGKTNVPEFAASYVAANYANGRTLNPFDHALITGGSAGGSASAVASFLAPVAVAEDSSGSTREPALQCHTFGYDPTHRHFPNLGNAPAEPTKDQIGIVSRSLEDILVLDAALLGTQKQHARAAKDAPSISEMRIGAPKHLYLQVPQPPPSPHGTVLLATPDVISKYDAVKGAISEAGCKLVHEELPNRSWDLLMTEGSLFNMWKHAQMWINSFVGADTAMQLVYDDFQPMGACHDPQGMFKAANQTSASMNQKYLATLPSRVNLWNSYFDEHALDLIITPAQALDAVTYADAAGATVPQLMRINDSVTFRTKGDIMNGMWPYFWFKEIPMPKLMVPTGLDEKGRPTGVMLWGRAMPADKLNDSVLARTFDLSFLYKAKVVVDRIQAHAQLKRANAPLVADLFPPNLPVSSHAVFV